MRNAPEQRVRAARESGRIYTAQHAATMRGKPRVVSKGGPGDQLADTRWARGSRHSMTESTDPDLYPGTDVLKNLREIHNPGALSRFGGESTAPSYCRVDSYSAVRPIRHNPPQAI